MKRGLVPHSSLCLPVAGHPACHPGAPAGGQALCGSCDYILPPKAGELKPRDRPGAIHEPTSDLTYWDLAREWTLLQPTTAGHLWRKPNWVLKATSRG